MTCKPFRSQIIRRTQGVYRHASREKPDDILSGLCPRTPAAQVAVVWYLSADLHPRQRDGKGEFPQRLRASD